MKQKSLKVNAVLNIVKTLMGIIFPLITFPYASRVLMPDGIGKVNFAQSIIQYFSLLASLGITSYGVREGAKIRNSKEKLSRFAKEIFTINIISTAFAYTLLIIALFVVPKFSEYRSLLIVCSASMLFTTLGMEWLYTAEEDFTYITVRAILFQFLSLILLFVLVHSPNDVLQYAAISVVSYVGSNICNFVHARKYISFKDIRIRAIDLKKHMKPVMILFIMAITSSIYTILDTSMLGFLASDYEVGLYTAATKINRIVLNLVVSVGTVLLPRLSFYYGTGENEKFKDLAYKSVDLLMTIAFPAAVGLSVLSYEVLYVISGPNYIPAVPAMRAINPIIVIVGMSNFIGVQIFMPLRKEKWTLYSDISGACTNLVLNSILIPKYGALGAAIASVSAESIVTLTQLILVRRFLSIKKIVRNIYIYVILSLIMGVAVYIVHSVISNVFISLILGIVVGMLIYAIELLIVKNEWMIYILDKVKARVSR